MGRARRAGWGDNESPSRRSPLGRLRRFERGPENVGSRHLRVQRTYQRAARSCFVQDVVHSEHFRVVTPYSPQAALALARRARGQLLPRVADAVSSSARCAAVLMIAVWGKACGKFRAAAWQPDRTPRRAGRDRFRARASARIARSHRRAARLARGCWRARSCRQEKPFAGRQPVIQGDSVAAHEAVLHQLALDRFDRAANRAGLPAAGTRAAGSAAARRRDRERRNTGRRCCAWDHKHARGSLRQSGCANPPNGSAALRTHTARPI